MLGPWTGAQCGWVPSPPATSNAPLHPKFPPDTPYTPRNPLMPPIHLLALEYLHSAIPQCTPDTPTPHDTQELPTPLWCPYMPCQPQCPLHPCWPPRHHLHHCLPNATWNPYTPWHPWDPIPLSSLHHLTPLHPLLAPWHLLSQNRNLVVKSGSIAGEHHMLSSCGSGCCFVTWASCAIVFSFQLTIFMSVL